MDLPKQIFKSYDIRGIYPDELNEEVAKEIALLFLSFVSRQLDKTPTELKILVAKDIRNSSSALSTAFIKQFVNKGVTVYDLALAPIDMVYMGIGKYPEYDAGVIVTASHNPGKYGGFKMAIKNANWVRGIDLLNENLIRQKFEDQSGAWKELDLWSEYLKHIFSFVDISKIKPLKIVVDAGNGMAGIVIQRIMEFLPQVELISLFFEPDGDFPNRDPNPLNPGAFEKLAEKVKLEKADVGIMFDADADRIFLVDEQGRFLKGDETILVLAKQLLNRQLGAGIVYNLISSKNVPQAIVQMGGRPIRSEVGYVNMGKHMREENGLMGGEVSGHYSFAENYYYDSGFISFLMILEAMSTENFKLSEFIDHYSYWQKAPDLNLEIEDKDEALEKIREVYEDRILDEIDGITVEFDDVWFNVRPSNTEALLRLTVEAKSLDLALKKQEELMKIIST